MTSNPTEGVSEPPAPQPAAPRRKRSWLRRLLGSVVVLVILLVLLVLLAPTLLSTGPGTRLALSFVNDSIKGRIEIDDLHLSWFSGPKVSGLRVKDPAGKVVAEVPGIDVPQLSLWQTIRGSLNVGPVNISNPKLDVVQNADGTLNLTEAFSPRTPKPKSNKPPTDLSGLNVQVALTGGQVSYAAAGAAPVQVTGLTSNLDVVGPKSVQLKVEGQVAQAGQQSTLRISAQGKDVLDQWGGLQLGKADLTADADVPALPVAAIDQVLKQSQRLADLLGPTLKVHLTTSGPLANPTLNLTASSPKLTARVEIQNSMPTTNTAIHLVVDDQTRALLATAGKPMPGKLLKPGFVDIKVGQASATIVNGLPDPMTVKADLALTISPLELDTQQDLGVVSLSETKGLISFNGPDHARFNVTLDSAASVGGAGAKAGHVNLKAELTDALTPEGKFNGAGFSATVTAALTDWPMAVVDQLAGRSGLAVVSIGPEMNANLQGAFKPTADGGATGDLTMKLASQRLNGDLAFGVTGDRHVQVRPTQGLTWKIDTALVQTLVARFAPGNEDLKKLTMGNPASLTLSIPKLDVPLDGSPAAKTVAQIQVTATPVALTGVPVTGTAGLNGLKVDLSYDGPTAKLTASVDASAALATNAIPVHLGADLSHLVDAQGKFVFNMASGKIAAKIDQLPSGLVDAVMTAPGLGAALAGPTLDWQLGADVTPDAAATMPKMAWQTGIKSQNLQASAMGSLVAQKLVLAKGTAVSLTVDPNLVAVAAGRFTALRDALGTRKLAQPAKVQLTVDHLALDFNAGWRKAQGAAKLTVDQIVPTGDPLLATAAVRQLVLDVPQADLAGTTKVALDAAFEFQGKQGSMHLPLVLVDPLGAAPSFQLDKGKVTNLPVALVGTLAKQNDKALALIGPVLESADVSVAPDAADKSLLNFALGADTKDQLHVALAGKFKAGAQLATSKAEGWLVISPAAFDVLLKNSTTGALPDQMLTAPVRAELAVSDLDLALVSRTAAPATAQPITVLPLDPARSHLALKLTIPSAALRSRSKGQETRATDLTLSADARSLSGAIAIKAGGKFELALPAAAGSAAAAPLSGTLTSSTTIENVIDSQGVMDSNRATVTTDTTAANLPVGLIDQVMNMNGKLAGIVGASADITAKGKYQGGAGGNLDLSMKGPNAQVDLPMLLDKDRNLTLSRDSIALMQKLTPDLAQALGTLNPMFLDALSSDKPLRMTIAKDGFIVPLADFKMTKVNAKIDLDAATLVMKHGWLTKPLISGLSSLLGGGSANDEYHASLTKLHVDVVKGVASSTDLWATTNDLLPARLIAFGTKVDSVNLDTKDSQVRAALSGVMLSQIKPIAKYLPPDYIYEVTMRGPVSQLQPDYTSLFVQLTQMALKAGGGDATGRFLGGLIPKNVPGADMVGSELGTWLTSAAGKLPGAKDQAQLQQQWPNRPKATALPSVPGVTTPAQPAQPSGPAQPATPPPAKQPPPKPQPKPLIPLPPFLRPRGQ